MEQEGVPQRGLHVHLTFPGESLPSMWDFTAEPPGSPLMSHNPRSLTGGIGEFTAQKPSV